MKDVSFERRVLIAVSITGFAFLLVLFLWYANAVLLVAHAGLLVAVFLHGLAVRIQSGLGIRYSFALLIVAVTLLILLVGSALLVAPRLADQVDQVSSELPKTWSRIEHKLEESRLGRHVLEEARQAIPRRSIIWSRVAGAFSTTLGGLANVFLILFLGIYMAASPGLYFAGIRALIPPRHRDRLSQVANEIREILWWWVLGRLFAMSVIAGMSFVGLSVIGVRLALVLSLLAGILNFIPYIGPIASAIPAVFLALPDGGHTVLWVVILYACAQVIESYFLTPMVDKRSVSLPPALTVTAQLLFGSVAGILGLALASPITASTIVLVRRLYVEGTLAKTPEGAREPTRN